MSPKFQNRIAIHYMIATAVTMAVAFAAIYFAVSETVVRNLDSDLSFEAQKHTGEIIVAGDSIKFKNKQEWEEREHLEVQVNPVFIQLIDSRGLLMDKSPNLKEDNLTFKNPDFDGHFNSEISHRKIRQIQLPLEEEGKTIGYILAAMSSESATSTLLKLRNVLIISYLFVLIGLYFISRALAGRSIIPVVQVTETISRITKNNLDERVQLPQNKDEIHELSSSFNSLLDRMENALQRERQFTSDASHELRTPLAALRGTLEVLIRKPREQKEYEEKVTYSLSQIEKISDTLEQLLILARLDSNSAKLDKTLIPLPTLIDESLGRMKNLILEKQLEVDFQFDKENSLLVPQYYANLIIQNILSNAVKYSYSQSAIRVSILAHNSRVICTVQDSGIGIKEEDLKKIYNSFFRSEALSHKHISGNGLGLTLAKKCADAIGAEIDVKSTINQGTTATITF